MLSSIEMRWFFPHASVARPAMFPSSEADESRVDHYALSHPQCGMKYRQGNLEVKLLTQDLGIRNFQQRQGRLQQWQKWSYSDWENPTVGQLENTGWIAVEKRRSQVFYAVDQDDVRPSSAMLAHGCALEWTTVSVGNETWLTVGIESFGLGDHADDLLCRAIDHLLPRLPEKLTWTKENSLSYPEWLHQWRLKSS